MDYLGLAIIAIATGKCLVLGEKHRKCTGGIKPCVSAFAADQFPAHMCRERAQFFSFFYFAINAGGLMAVLLVPMLRDRV